MKICFLTNDVFSLGGIQRVVSVVASELAEENDVDIVCLSRNLEIDRGVYNLNESIGVYLNNGDLSKNILQKIYSKTIRTINLKTNLLKSKSLTNWLTKAYFCKSFQNKIADFLNAKDYDVVIGVSGDLSLLVAILADRLKARTIGWQHNSYEAYFDNKSQYFWNQLELFKKHIPKLDEYFVLTDDDKKKVDKAFNIESRRVYNPVSFSSAIKSSCEEKVILFVGRLVEYQKGIDLLIDAFSKIYKKCDGWVLKIVGDGTDRDKISNKIQALNLSKRIIMEPYTSNISEYYQNSSIFVSSSRWEGFGLVLIEAMECGLPVIAFENSGPKEIINENNVNGILVKQNDVDMLAGKMLELINDENKRKYISKKSIERAKDFSSKKIGMEWIDVLNRLYDDDGGNMNCL